MIIERKHRPTSGNIRHNCCHLLVCPWSFSVTHPALDPHNPIQTFRNRYHGPHFVSLHPSPTQALSQRRGSHADYRSNPIHQKRLWYEAPLSASIMMSGIRLVPFLAGSGCCRSARSLEHPGTHSVIAGRPTLLGVAECWGGSLDQKGTLQGRTHDVTTAQTPSHGRYGRYVLGGLSERLGSFCEAPSVHNDALGSGRLRVRVKGRTRV